jgi:hypothetical protein
VSKETRCRSFSMLELAANAASASGPVSASAASSDEMDGSILPNDLGSLPFHAFDAIPFHLTSSRSGWSELACTPVYLHFMAFPPPDDAAWSLPLGEGMDLPTVSDKHWR